MSRSPRRRLLPTAILLAGLATPAAGQVGLEASFKGYKFDEGLGPTAAQLLVTPIAVRIPIGSSLQTDIFAAWARGEVERAGATYRLEGWVDTQVKASWTAAPWVVLSVAVNAPTGNESHTPDEAAVAAVLASDLLGFRESTWGTGLAITSGLATATRVGSWGLGVGASYRVANGFEPADGQSVVYQPGNETRVRVGLDRNVGEAGKLSLGFTYQDFAEDQVAGRNYFRAGSRQMVDGSYAFRLGSQTWTLYGANVWRQQGDLFLSVINGAGAVVGDSAVATGSQQLLSAGFAGAIPLGSIFRIRPSADFRMQTREELNGSDEGSGWVVSAGADLPLRFFQAMDVFPRARVTRGSITGPDQERHSATGGEFGVTVRFGG